MPLLRQLDHGATPGDKHWHVSLGWQGLAVVMCMQPFDFAATRVVNQPAGGAVYKGPMDCIRQTVQQEGVVAIYKGVTANYLRFGPYCILVFVFLEQLRSLEAKFITKERPFKGTTAVP